jgi:cobalamin biosynthesis protein CobT
MPAEEEPFESESFNKDDYVAAFFARNIDEAEEYCELLCDHDIPARAGLDEELLAEADPDHRAASRLGMTHGVPVLVPESLLDEASEIIADREDFDEFEDEEEPDEQEDEEDFGIGEVAASDLISEDEEEDEEEEEELPFDDEEEEDEDEEF